jgi:nitrite reductase (NADH) small subunit
LPTVSAGAVEDLPVDRCVEIADGRAVVVRVDCEVYAYRNECLHQASPLAGGLVKDEVITCPLHFWRYEAGTGAKCGEPELRLETYPVRIESGNVLVDLPAPPATGSWREMMLDHAREWDREDG